jgi:hypothetical protein
MTEACRQSLSPALPCRSSRDFCGAAHSERINRSTHSLYSRGDLEKGRIICRRVEGLDRSEKSRYLVEKPCRFGHASIVPEAADIPGTYENAVENSFP